MSARTLPLLYTPLMDILSIAGQVNRRSGDGITDESRTIRVLTTDGVLAAIQSGLLGIASRKEAAAAKHLQALADINAKAEKEMRDLITQIETLIAQEPQP